MCEALCGRDGRISTAELGAAVGRLVPEHHLSPPQLSLLCAAIDADGNGSIDFAEFTQYFRVGPDSNSAQVWQQRLKVRPTPALRGHRTARSASGPGQWAGAAGRG